MAKPAKKRKYRRLSGGHERYPWKTLKPLHHFFLPGRNARIVRVAANKAAERYGFKMSVRQCALDGVEGVLVWRHAEPAAGLFD